jgi:hypothetical protein
MVCAVVKLPTGGAAIVCTTTRRRRCACGRTASLLCDWKVPKNPSGTCDAPLCERCTSSPAPQKDLCPRHADQWRRLQAERAQPETCA